MPFQAPYLNPGDYPNLGRKSLQRMQKENQESKRQVSPEYASGSGALWEMTLVPK